MPLSNNSQPAYNSAQRAQLQELARASIAEGLIHDQPLTVDPRDYPENLREARACFITLERKGALRGCIGSLEPRRPLVVDVAHNAYAAAFQDPRFPPLRERECADLDLHISVLSLPEPLRVDSREALLRALRPGGDGLILSAGHRRATFLPSVWEQLPAAEDFVDHLLRKGGWKPGAWPPGMEVSRYRSEQF